MNTKQRKRKRISQYSAAEKWLYSILSRKTCHRWVSRKLRRSRLLDFWNGPLGCAVQIDDPEHPDDRAHEKYRDEMDFRLGAVVTLRVRAFSMDDAQAAVRHIRHLRKHWKRKEQIGVAGYSKSVQRRLASLPYPPSYLAMYLHMHIDLNNTPFAYS